MLITLQVETIRNLVDSYIKIVTKKIKDQVPKMITCFLINEVKKFIHGDLLRSLLMDGEQLMEESPEEARRRQEMLSKYQNSDASPPVLTTAHFYRHVQLFEGSTSNHW